MSENRNLGRQKGANKLRLRPSVMLGSDDIRGVQQTFFEIVSNSIDRFKKGYGNKIIITRHKDNSFTIQDFADGLPMDWNEEEQAYNWELALRVLYAGDNYEQSESNDGVLGYNGLGLTSTQFTSEFMNVDVYKKGTKYSVRCKEGRPVNYETDSFICDDVDELFTKENGALILKKSTVESHLTGTIINYKPDLKVFTDINIPVDWMRNKLKKQVVVNQGLEIILNDELNEIEETFKYDSLDQYIGELGQEKNLIDIVNFNGNGIGRDVKTKPEYQVGYEVSFTFNNEYPKCEYYHNSSELTELKDNATTKAVEKAFVGVIHNHINSNGLYKAKEGKIKFADIEDSLLLVISSKSTQTSYANQTKLAIDNQFIREFVSEDISDKLHLFMIENKDVAKQIMDRVLVNFRSRVKSDASRKALKKKLSEKVGGILNKVEGLIEAKDEYLKSGNAILCICEGQSALGSLVSGKQGKHAIYPLRGKILNCAKASDEKIFENDVINGLMKALGCGVELKSKHNKDLSNFNIDNLRYKEIYIIVDYDFDGIGSILPLLLAMFEELTPTLIREGKIKVCETPKYEIEVGKDTLYAFEDEELEKIKNTRLKNKKYKINYVKGLAELSNEAMTMCLADGYPNITQITLEHIEKSLEMFEIFMGKDIKVRKEFILTNFKGEPHGE